MLSSHLPDLPLVQVGVENRKRPTTIALSRQNMPNLPGCTREGVTKGAYIIKDCQGTPDVILMGTGSELELAYGAAEVGEVWVCHRRCLMARSVPVVIVFACTGYACWVEVYSLRASQAGRVWFLTQPSDHGWVQANQILLQDLLATTMQDLTAIAIVLFML